MSNFVPEQLDRLSDLYRSRNSEYGNNYMQFGPAIKAMFPNGVMITTEHDFNRIGVLVQAYAKFTRYVANFSRGGHSDSLDDLAVYAMMLKEIDQKQQDEIEKELAAIRNPPMTKEQQEAAWANMAKGLEDIPNPAKAPPAPDAGGILYDSGLI